MGTTAAAAILVRSRLPCLFRLQGGGGGTSPTVVDLDALHALEPVVGAPPRLSVGLLPAEARVAVAASLGFGLHLWWCCQQGVFENLWPCKRVRKRTRVFPVVTPYCFVFERTNQATRSNGSRNHSHRASLEHFHGTSLGFGDWNVPHCLLMITWQPPTHGNQGRLTSGTGTSQSPMGVSFLSLRTEQISVPERLLARRSPRSCTAC